MFYYNISSIEVGIISFEWQISRLQTINRPAIATIHKQELRMASFAFRQQHPPFPVNFAAFRQAVMRAGSFVSHEIVVGTILFYSENDNTHKSHRLVIDRAIDGQKVDIRRQVKVVGTFKRGHFRHFTIIDRLTSESYEHNEHQHRYLFYFQLFKQQMQRHTPNI